MIAVVDYCKGNLKSVERGLRFVGGDAHIIDDPAEIARAQAIVLPGVGAFADAAHSMESAGQMPVLREAITKGVPFLGICLGLHLLYEEGAEDAPEGGPNTRGLSVLPGVVDRMPSRDASCKLYKIPHVGWNTINIVDGAACPLLEGVSSGEYFYFTHSYIAPDSANTVATTTHSVAFPCVAQFGDVAFGVQFHPEKSSDAGMAVLENFLRVVKAAG